jgi:hypothetical protein
MKPHGVVCVDAVGAAAVRDHVAATRQGGHDAGERRQGRRDRARDVTGAILGFGPHVEDDGVAPLQALLQLLCGDQLDAAALAEVLAGEHVDLRHVTGRDVAHRRPQVAHAIARETVVDAIALAPRPDETGTGEQPQVLRRVRDALRDLVRELLDRALALREHIYDLRPAPIPERLADGGEGVEQGKLCRPAVHKFNLVLE